MASLECNSEGMRSLARTTSVTLRSPFSCNWYIATAVKNLLAQVRLMNTLGLENIGQNSEGGFRVGVEHIA